MKSLKSTYRRDLALFTAINFVVFWVIILSPVDLNTWQDVYKTVTLKDGVFLSLSPIATIILGLFSATAKARLVYWHYNYPLPGSRAFTVHMKTDHRIDPKTLEKKWGPLPTNPEDQNRLWYRIYKDVERDIRVQESHRDWLFSRDLAAYSVFFLIVFVPSAVGSNANWRVTLIYVIITIVQYLILIIAARTYGNRFVCNVLAIESQSDFDLK
ncbi:MAG TPA: hypothetical protein PLK94_01570 [Alphaproteobacteria bacterium]|nr:hypothetical protein [Alphaproteobacteria bacterium]